MREDLFRVEAVSAYEEFFNRFKGADTVGHQRIVENKIGVVGEVWFNLFIAIANRVIDVAVNVRQANPFDFLEGARRRIFEAAFDKGQIVEPQRRRMAARARSWWGDSSNSASSSCISADFSTMAAAA